MTELQRLLTTDMAGDPMVRRGLWTGLRLRQIAARLRRIGLRVSPNTVRRLLSRLGIALHANRKSLCAPCPERDRQFRYLKRQRRDFEQAHAPIISVDTKKRELVGNFKNPGRLWCQEPIPVHDHDFPSLGHGLAIPYGIYDCQANRGSVVVGTSRNTPAFAAESIRQWWCRDGRRRYPDASRLLILADNGGSNGADSHLWKHALQQRLADPFRLSVTVCHYPSGASKWNPIEHRLFSEISKQWAGQPLVDYPTVLQQIRKTHTRTGLTVTSTLDTRCYPTGIKLSSDEIRRINLHRHSVLPSWNYTLSPRRNGN